MCNLLDGLVALGCTMLRDVKDRGQQMGYRSLEWNWPKEAMNIPIWAGIVDWSQAVLTFYNNNNIKEGHSLRRAYLQPATNTQNSKPRPPTRYPRSKKKLLDHIIVRTTSSMP